MTPVKSAFKKLKQLRQCFTVNIFYSPPEEVDICTYLAAMKCPTERLYFSPSKYIPPKHDPDMSSEEGGFVQSWIDLKRNLDWYIFQHKKQVHDQRSWYQQFLNPHDMHLMNAMEDHHLFVEPASPTSDW